VISGNRTSSGRGRALIFAAAVVLAAFAALVPASRPASAQGNTQGQELGQDGAAVARSSAGSTSNAVEQWLEQNRPATESAVEPAVEPGSERGRMPAPAMPPVQPPAPGGLSSVLGSGSVDWGNGRAAFSAGERLSPDEHNPGRARALALRRATLAARKALLDGVLSLALDGSRTVGSALPASTLDTIRALVQNSPVQQEELPDADGGMTLTVTAVMELRGELAELLLPAAEPFLAGVPPTTALTVSQVPRPQPDPDQASYRSSMAELGGFTGLVVDARGLGAVPALLPLVLDPEGLQAYGPFQISRDDAVENGAALYVEDPANSLLGSRAGSTPLKVRALAVSGPGMADIVVSETDARFIRTLFKNEDARHRCAVVVVIDRQP
jgi:hypothetical protein